MAEFHANTHDSATTGVSPFFANYGYYPKTRLEPPQPVPKGIPVAERRNILAANKIANRMRTLFDHLGKEMT